MIFNAVEFHNIEKIYHHKGIEGGLLQRIPEEVGNSLSQAAQMMMICPSGVEIRFVSETYPVKMTLSVDKIIDRMVDDHTEVYIFFGTVQSRQRFTITRQKTTIEITMPYGFMDMAKKVSPDASFSPHVCRIRLWGTTMGAPIRFHSIETEGNIRPPKPEELPKLRYMAYGSSITQGAFASGPHLSYASQVGYRLGADVINLGTSCSAYCEPELADYIASRDDWDFATLALSVNMVELFSPEEFSDRIAYMINRIAQSDAKRPVVCITIKPYYGDYLESKSPNLYRNLLREAVASSPHDNVYLIEGPELMPDAAGGLCPDFIHLGDNGMIQIGENLSKKLIPILRAHDLFILNGCKNKNG
ncbi:MAG: hypothetical protein KJ737_13765 [Proteobacteria bacterium]|nr:hypothetical protein [Pseudomonadota bacterium]